MLFDFNIYSSLLLVPFLHAIIFAFLFFFRYRKEERMSDMLLGGVLLLNAIKIAYWMLGFAGWYDSHNAYTSFMFYFPFNNMLLLGPLVYFYFLSLTNAQFNIRHISYYHLILPIACFVLIVGKALIDVGFYYPFDYSELTQFGTKGPFAELDKNKLFTLIGYLSFSYYLIKTLQAFKAYRIYLQDNFSSTHKLDLKWLRNLIYLCGFGAFTFFIFDLIGLINSGNSFRFDWYAYLGLGFVTYYLSIAGFYNYSDKWHFLSFNAGDSQIVARESASHYSKSEVIAEAPKEIQSDDMHEWIRKLKEIIQDKSLFLEPQLTLSELSRHAKTNPSFLSKIINNTTGQNFNDFINEFRVKSVIQKLEAGEQEKQTLLGIAYDSGLNSKATFNRSFKKITGVSPKEYLLERFPKISN